LTLMPHSTLREVREPRGAPKKRKKRGPGGGSGNGRGLFGLHGPPPGSAIRHSIVRHSGPNRHFLTQIKSAISG